MYLRGDTVLDLQATCCAVTAQGVIYTVYAVVLYSHCTRCWRGAVTAIATEAAPPVKMVALQEMVQGFSALLILLVCVPRSCLQSSCSEVYKCCNGCVVCEAAGN